MSGRARFVRVQVVVFTLPTEYGRCRTMMVRTEDGREAQLMVFDERAETLRNLRRGFYNALKRVAWRSPLGWLLFSDADPSVLEGWMRQLSEVAGETRRVYIVDILVPLEVILEWLDEHVAWARARATRARRRGRRQEAMRLERLIERLMEERTRLLARAVPGPGR